MFFPMYAQTAVPEEVIRYQHFVLLSCSYRMLCAEDFDKYLGDVYCMIKHEVFLQPRMSK